MAATTSSQCSSSHIDSDATGAKPCPSPSDQDALTLSNCLGIDLVRAEVFAWATLLDMRALRRVDLQLWHWATAAVRQRAGVTKVDVDEGVQAQGLRFLVDSRLVPDIMLAEGTYILGDMRLEQHVSLHLEEWWHAWFIPRPALRLGPAPGPAAPPGPPGAAWAAWAVSGQAESVRHLLTSAPRLLGATQVAAGGRQARRSRRVHAAGSRPGAARAALRGDVDGRLRAALEARLGPAAAAPLGARVLVAGHPSPRRCPWSAHAPRGPRTRSTVAATGAHRRRAAGAGRARDGGAQPGGLRSGGRRRGGAHRRRGAVRRHGPTLLPPRQPATASGTPPPPSRPTAPPRPPPPHPPAPPPAPPPPKPPPRRCDVTFEHLTIGGDLCPSLYVRGHGPPAAPHPFAGPVLRMHRCEIANTCWLAGRAVFSDCSGDVDTTLDARALCYIYGANGMRKAPPAALPPRRACNAYCTRHRRRPRSQPPTAPRQAQLGHDRSDQGPWRLAEFESEWGGLVAELVGVEPDPKTLDDDIRAVLRIPSG